VHSLTEFEVAISGAYEAWTGAEPFKPVVTGEPAPDCGLVTDITLKARAGIFPNGLGSADGSIFEQLPAISQ
jgi:hypothetical protein